MILHPLRRARAALAVLAAIAGPAGTAGAQVLPSTPISIDDGRIVIGGEASASIAPRDNGYFNYTDYDQNALRLLRLSLAAEWRVSGRVWILGDIRTENWNGVRPYGLYVRIRPWAGRSVDVQAGRIPPAFGAFAHRTYGSDNPLIGYPLAYQYLTALRPDAVPTSAADLAAMRGRGWYLTYPVGAPGGAHGVPLISAFRWDTGVQVRVGDGAVQLAGAVTNGTLSNPRTRDDNAGKQVSGRLLLRPVVGLEVGVSAARGAFLGRTATAALPEPQQSAAYAQQAIGADAEYSRDHWLVRGEAIVASWRLPVIAPPPIGDPLRALAVSIEGRYKVRPAWFLAVRADRLTFSSIAPAGPGGARVGWDAPVSRVEVGAGCYLRRNVVGKLAYQHNWRDARRSVTRGFAAAQILYWF
jgi:hypothetical protein